MNDLIFPLDFHPNKDYLRVSGSFLVKARWSDLCTWSRTFYQTQHGAISFLRAVNEYLILRCEVGEHEAQRRNLERRARRHLCEREFKNLVYWFVYTLERKDLS